METSRVVSPAVRNVFAALVLWSLFALGMGVYYALDARPAAWAGIGVGVLTLVLALWGKKGGLWWQPLLTAHYVLAIGCVVAGPIADVDEYVVGGVICLTVLSVGLCILLRMEDQRAGAGK